MSENAFLLTEDLESTANRIMTFAVGIAAGYAGLALGFGPETVPGPIVTSAVFGFTNLFLYRLLFE